MGLSEKNFDEQIREKITELNLDSDQIILFSKLCAVRALPFIGTARNFGFWNRSGKNTQHLYAVLNAIDAIASYNTSLITSRAAARADAAAYAAANAAAAYAYAAAAAYTANAAYVAAAYANAAAAANAAAYAAANAANAARAISYERVIELRRIILEDLSHIKEGAYDKFDNNLSIYGDVWGNFQKVLRDIGCGYWGRLYENIFKNRFRFDPAALKMRLSVPAEIKKQGAKAVADYLEQMEVSGSENLNEARVIILGEKGAGKTCLARRLINPKAPMTKPKESTKGVDSKGVWKIEGESASSTVNARIWDFAGHVITHAAHRCFLSERCLYILVYDGRTERRNQLEYWLDHVRNYGGDAPVLVLINKFDDHKPDVPENTLKRKYPFIKSFEYFSIKEDKGELERFRLKTSELIRNDPIWNRDKIPASYYKVKNALGELFNGESLSNEYIEKSLFYEIARKNDIADNDIQERVLASLSLLGICLWYKDIERFDMLVLNPNWVSDGIYKVINWAHDEKKKSIVSLDDYENIFKDEKRRYPKDKFEYIFSLMEKYELAYSKNDGNIVIPHILKEDQPADLPVFPIGESLMIKYVSEQPLPPNTVCRLIVRHHEDIVSDDTVWRYGVVLNGGENATAMVIEDDRTITIQVKGEGKSGYISELRETMDKIFGSYKSKLPELQYRVVPVGEGITLNTAQQNEDGGIFLPAETIKSHLEEGRKYFEPQSKSDIDLEPTASGFNLHVHIGDKYGDVYGTVDNRKITNNFHNCNIELQGNLNELISNLDPQKDSAVVNELKDVVSDLEKAESLNSHEEAKKKGFLGKLHRLVKDMGDKNSQTYKVIKGVKNGMKIIQEIAKAYEAIDSPALGL